MTRLKKEFRKKGYPLESDYDHMPYYLCGRSYMDVGYILLEGIVVYQESAVMVRFLNIGAEYYKMNRDGSLSYRFE